MDIAASEELRIGLLGLVENGVDSLVVLLMLKIKVSISLYGRMRRRIGLQ